MFTAGAPVRAATAMTLDKFLDKLDRALREQPAAHPARVAFELARELGASLEFAGPEGQALSPPDLERWWDRGGPDPFLDGEGRATLRIKSSHRINDWAVINARLTHTGLTVDRRYRMLKSWVTDSE
jgi:hypothetical protein